MTEVKTLTVADFKDAIVYDCGLENRDPQRGYRKEIPVQETPLIRMLRQHLKIDLAAALTSDISQKR